MLKSSFRSQDLLVYNFRLLLIWVGSFEPCSLNILLRIFKDSCYCSVINVHSVVSCDSLFSISLRFHLVKNFFILFSSFFDVIRCLSQQSLCYHNVFCLSTTFLNCFCCLHNLIHCFNNELKFTTFFVVCQQLFSFFVTALSTSHLLSVATTLNTLSYYCSCVNTKFQKNSLSFSNNPC